MADYNTFVDDVATVLGAGSDIDDAERATDATLRTLAERLGKDEVVILVPMLGPELGGLVFTVDPPQTLSVDAFLARVAERGSVDADMARRYSAAVFFALARALGEREYDNVRGRLPAEFRPLLARGEYTGVPTADEFSGVVADFATIPPEVARGVTEAVLETIAEHIAPAEVDRLRGQLPIELHPALDRGLARNRGDTTSPPVDGFVAEVAEHAAEPAPGKAAAPALTTEEARVYARTVFDVLRDTITDKEFFDLTAQLPDVYRDLQSTR